MRGSDWLTFGEAKVQAKLNVGAVFPSLNRRLNGGAVDQEAGAVQLTGLSEKKDGGVGCFGAT